MPMSLARLFATLPLWAFLVPVLAAQQQKEPPAAQFGVSANEVIVPITVTDDKGRFVSNLEAKDFRILDEGRPQRIQFFSHDQRQPIVVGFLIDMSNNTRIHWKTYQDAILELVWDLLPGDKKYTGYLITYSNDAELVVNTTWDSDKIADQIKKLRPGGGASLFDAIYMACTKRELVQGEPFEPRRVLIVVGDGHDNASKKSIEEVLELAQRNLVTIYAMSTQAFGFANDTQDVLERITAETGGVAADQNDPAGVGGGHHLHPAASEPHPAGVGHDQIGRMGLPFRDVGPDHGGRRLSEIVFGVFDGAV